MPPTASGARRRARSVGGDARLQRGRAARADPEGDSSRALRRARPGRSRCSWSRTARPTTLADARALRGRRRRWSWCSPGRSPTTARRCAPGSSPPPGTSSSCSTSTTTTSRSSTRSLPALTADDGPAIVVGSKRAPGTRDTRPWPRRRHHRRLLVGAAARVRAQGVGHPRHEGDAARDGRADRRALPQRHRSLRHRARAAGRARRAAGRRGAGDGRGASPVAHADRPARCRARVGARAAPDPALAGRRLDDAPRFAAALSEHPSPSHAVGEVAGEMHGALRRRRSRPRRVLRLAALRRAPWTISRSRCATCSHRG